MEVIENKNRGHKEKFLNLEKSSNSLRGILLNSFFIVNSICVCVPLSKKKEYSILFHGSGTIEKKGSGISWNVYYNATKIILIRRSPTTKKRKRDLSFGGNAILPLAPFRID